MHNLQRFCAILDSTLRTQECERTVSIIDKVGKRKSFSETLLRVRITTEDTVYSVDNDETPDIEVWNVKRVRLNLFILENVVTGVFTSLCVGSKG